MCLIAPIKHSNTCECYGIKQRLRYKNKERNALSIQIKICIYPYSFRNFDLNIRSSTDYITQRYLWSLRKHLTFVSFTCDVLIGYPFVCVFQNSLEDFDTFWIEKGFRCKIKYCLYFVYFVRQPLQPVGLTLVEDT